MNFTFEIAKRYLLSKKSTSAINIITWVSIAGMTIGTAALVLILSVFNGFEGLLAGLSNSFNPDLKISPIEGKFFAVDSTQIAEIRMIDGVLQVAKSIEEICLFEYKEVQQDGMIKGVDEYYAEVTSIDSTIREGKFSTLEGNRNLGVLGRGLSVNLSINRKDAGTPVSVHMPTLKSSGVMSSMGKEFKTISVYPTAVFNVGSEDDIRYMLTNIETVAKLLDKPGQISNLEISIVEDGDEDDIKSSIASILGEGYKIDNRYQQEESFLKVMNIEKWISFLIVMLTLTILAFNMVGSLWMMVLEKKKDISILRSMGYETSQIRSVFMMQGMLITGIGIVLGMLIAILLYGLQKQFGLVSVPDGFMISAYPIELRWTDFVVVAVTVAVIGWLASILPSYRAGQVSASVRQEID